jgi:hypothetical protein
MCRDGRSRCSGCKHLAGGQAIRYEPDHEFGPQKGDVIVRRTLGAERLYNTDLDLQYFSILVIN